VGPAPTADDLAAHYNRRALETLLIRALSADLYLRSPDGAAIRRLYFAVKRAGLLCELSLQEPDAGAAGGVWAHLFGPLELFGPRTRHGERFARAVLELQRAFPDLEGSARVLINEREYTLRLPRGIDRATAGPVEFDSSIERHLYETLRGMERTGDTRDWIVQREPEPIVHGATVLVPDFALSRPATAQDDPVRVFVEVIGFWTPAYRERKKAKLLALGGGVDLVLVVQDELAADFAGLPYEVLTYKRRPSAHDLIVLVDRAHPRKAPRRRLARARDVPPPEQTRAEWESVFGAATASASPAAPGTPAA
jgi:predicted nuclease of restriction endonuclease-like RecB superfamily